jgi:hypothetical protein
MRENELTESKAKMMRKWNNPIESQNPITR